MDFSNSACDFVYLFILGKKLSMNWPVKKKKWMYCFCRLEASVGQKASGRLFQSEQIPGEGCENQLDRSYFEDS